MYDYVGFTEEEFQAWLSNFRLLQQKMVSLVLAKYRYTLIFSVLQLPPVVDIASFLYRLGSLVYFTGGCFWFNALERKDGHP